MVQHELSDHARTILQIRQYPADGQEGWYDRCWRAIHRLLDTIDPCPYPRKRTLDKSEAERIIAERDPRITAVKQARLDRVTSDLTHVTMRLLPRDVRRRWKGNVCIDATPVQAFARGKSKRSTWHSAEIDAAWYVREADHRDLGDEKGNKYRKVMWGWEATIAVAVTNTPTSDIQDFPLLAVGVAFGKPGFDIASTALGLFTDLQHRGHPAGTAIGDRAYFPNSAAVNLQSPLRQLGYKLAFDYREDQLGHHGGHAGAMFVEGHYYCPSMPVPLIEATIDRRAGRIDDDTYTARIAQRSRYLLRPKESADTNGNVPLMCPAVGPSATAACPLKPTSMKGPNVANRVQIKPTNLHPGPICTNKTSVTFPAHADAKYRQDLRYGTPEWHALYSAGRNTIEGFNGYIKDGAHEALADPTRRRLRGYTAQYLLVTLLVVSANIRKIRAWMATATPDQHGVLVAIKKRYPRKPGTTVTVNTIALQRAG